MYHCVFSLSSDQYLHLCLETETDVRVYPRFNFCLLVSVDPSFFDTETGFFVSQIPAAGTLFVSSQNRLFYNTFHGFTFSSSRFVLVPVDFF